MENLKKTWLAPWLPENPGIAWSAGWFAVPAVAMFVFAALPDTGVIARLFFLLVGALHAFAALGLLRGVKSAWHIATFLAFLTIVTRLLAVACAPGEIADGDQHLGEAAIDVVTLAIAILVYTYLRRPEVRALFSVPLEYRIPPDTANREETE